MGLILRRDISTPLGEYTLSVDKEDLSSVYPGMIRFAVLVRSGEQIFATFRTNTYEYPPTVQLEAEQLAMAKAGKWAGELSEDPQKFFSSHRVQKERELSVPQWTC